MWQPFPQQPKFKMTFIAFKGPAGPKKKRKKETSIHLTAAHQSLKQTLTASNGICNENFFQLN